ncbi:MAG: hypothetical protein NZ934_03705 [Hadesarchaea archaeon]|nr:hypothetical protein [Hadesarchaea archaeon]
MQPTSKITILFAILGAIAGSLSGLFSNVGVALLLALIFFYGGYRWCCSMFGIKKPKPQQPSPAQPQPTQPPIESGRKIVMTGITPFFVMWLIFWIMTYTIKLAA